MDRPNRRQRRRNQAQNQGGDQQEQQPEEQQRNRIRGPTSALSSFLREHGIRVENRSRRRQREPEEQEAVAAASSASPETTTTDPTEANSASSSTTGTPEPSNSTNITNILYTPGRRRQLNASATRIIQAAEASSKAAKGKRKKPSGDDDSENESDTTDYNEPGPSSRRPMRERRNEIVFCDKCKSRFARPLSSANDIETDNICPSCLRGEPLNKKAKTKTTKKRRPNIPERDKVPSLQDICISIVADYIDDVEAFGEIGLENMDKLAKIISKNRKLTARTTRLFLEPTAQEMTLYDCTDVDTIGLLNIAQFCPKIKRLKLLYCGQMTSEVLHGYGTRLNNLQAIELSGPYLVTTEAWIEFIKTVGSRLESFKVSHTFRFTEECLKALVENCPNLKELKFSRLNKMQDSWLPWIEKFTKLTSLELAFPDPKQRKEFQIQSTSVIKVLEAIGENLVTLALAGLTTMDDMLLLDGLADLCPNIRSLNLHDCPNITSEGIQELFTEWNKSVSSQEQEKENGNAKAVVDKEDGIFGKKRNKGLEHLNISRCIAVDDEAFKAVLIHSSHTLKTLSLHSLDKLSAGGLEMLAGKYPEQKTYKRPIPTAEEIGTKACENLEELDCSFVRSMDDLVLKSLIDSCPSLKKIRVWGCNQLTNQISSTTCKIIGLELEQS